MILIIRLFILDFKFMIINKIKNLIITIGFFVLISLPVLSLFINFTPEQVLNEKRNLAKIPKPSLKTIFFFPKRFETYFNDNFGFRAFLIRCYTYFKINLLKSSQVSKVVIGKDGWLFFAGDDVINDYVLTEAIDTVTSLEIHNENILLVSFCFLYSVFRFIASIMAIEKAKRSIRAIGKSFFAPSRVVLPHTFILIFFTQLISLLIKENKLL